MEGGALRPTRRLTITMANRDVITRGPSESLVSASQVVCEAEQGYEVQASLQLLDCPGIEPGKATPIPRAIADEDVLPVLGCLPRCRLCHCFTHARARTPLRVVKAAWFTSAADTAAAAGPQASTR